MAVIFIFFDLENKNFRRGMVLYYVKISRKQAANDTSQIHVNLQIKES
jgi:hypothetical protein